MENLSIKAAAAAPFISCVKSLPLPATATAASYTYQDADQDGDGVLGKADIGWGSAFAHRFCEAAKIKLLNDLKKSGITIKSDATLNAIVKDNYTRKILPYLGKTVDDVRDYNKRIAAQGGTPAISF